MQKRSKWFNEARYGLFIHWGAYSQAARGEWVMNRERIPLEEYRNCYVKQFKAEHYDPADWMKKAVRWGMKYTVLTTRHHDGFALWDSKVNPYNAAKTQGRTLLFARLLGAPGLSRSLFPRLARGKRLEKRSTPQTLHRVLPGGTERTHDRIRQN